MNQVKFGSAHTIKKLDCLEAYLKAYLNVFKNMPWAHTIYVDAFAGTGEIPIASSYEQLPLDLDDQAFIVGSVSRALGIAENFAEYIFIEKKRGNARALERLKMAHPDKNILVTNTDANEGLQRLCAERDWKKCRAVVFLDPFGSQVSWSTLEALAKTRAIDLWYLFPAGLSVYRQIAENGGVHYTHEASLDRLFGTSDWRQAFIGSDEAEADLFGVANNNSVKTATPESVTKFMCKRLEIFEGGVLNEWLRLGRGDAHWYSLMFAWANPSAGAKKAGDIARAVMRSGKSGRSK